MLSAAQALADDRLLLPGGGACSKGKRCMGQCKRQK
jgi:hypothetical protein